MCRRCDRITAGRDRRCSTQSGRTLSVVRRLWAESSSSQTVAILTMRDSECSLGGCL